MRKKKNKPKHVAHRTCVGCREVRPKRTLIRIVRSPEGVIVDLSGKMHGRGAYLHNQKLCWERALKGPLAHALKTELTDMEKVQLTNFAETLKEEISDIENGETRKKVIKT